MKKISEYFRKPGPGGTASSDRGASSSRRKKIAAIVAAVVVVLLLIAVIAPFVIDLNRYKGPILARIRPAINRDADFQSIRLTVLTGLGAELTGLKVPENPAFGTGSFVSVDSVKVRLRILPLLRGQIRIARLVFKSPEVHVRRNEQGVFNFADMAKPKEKEEKKKLPAFLATFGISDLTIKNGLVQYEDRKVPDKPRAPGAPPAVKNLTVSRLDTSIENISLTDAVTIDAEGSLLDEPGTNFTLNGQVGPIGIDVKEGPIPVDLALTMDSVPMKKLTESLGLATRAASGALSGSVTAKGAVKQKITTVSKIVVSGFALQRKPGAPAPLKPAAASIGFDGRIVYDAAPQDVTIQTGTLSVNNSSFSLAGNARSVAKSPTWNIALRSVSVDAGSLVSAAPAFGVSLPANLSLKGPAKIQLTSTGSSQDMALETGLELSPAEIAMGSTFHKAPGVTFTLGSSANLRQGVLSFKAINLVLYNLLMTGTGEINTKGTPPDMKMQFASRPASLKGWDAMIPAMSTYRLGGDMALKAGVTGTTKSPEFTFTAASTQLGLTIPPNKAKGKEARETPVALQGLNLAVNGRMAEKKLAAGGTFGIQGGKYGEIALGKGAGSFTFGQGKLEVPSLQMGVFKGTVNASASYATVTKDWTFSPVIKGIDAGQALNTLTSFKNIFSGLLSGKMQVRGNTARKGLDSLATQGTITIDKGKMNNIDIVSSVVDGLAGVPGLTGMLTGEQGGVQRNRETQFDSLTTDFQLARKVLTIPSLKLSNIRTGKETNSMANMQGTVDMVSRKLGFKGNVAFSPEYSARLAQRTPPLNALMNNQKRIDLPIQITGTVNRPVLFLQTQEIARAVAGYYTGKGVEKGLEKLRKRFNIPGSGTGDSGNTGNTGNSGSTGSKGKSGTGNQVDDLLRGVFGK